jgi:hypothetical protein
VTLRCAQPLSDWLVAPIGKPGPVTSVVAVSLSMLFLASLTVLALLGLAYLGRLGEGSAQASRKMVLSWSFGGYLLVMVVGSIEQRVRRKTKSKRKDA